MRSRSCGLIAPIECAANKELGAPMPKGAASGSRVVFPSRKAAFLHKFDLWAGKYAVNSRVSQDSVDQLKLA